MEARRVFSETAAAFSQRELGPDGAQLLRFVAINCNDHRGDCRRKYKLFSYPVIFAYVPGAMQTGMGMPVVFDKPPTADRLAGWIAHLLRPVRRIHSRGELEEMLGVYEHVVVGYIPMGGPSGSRWVGVFKFSSF